MTVNYKSGYDVTYNANGGSGAPSAQTKEPGVTLKLSTTQPTRSGYTFKGWSTSSTATTATYSAGGNYTADANVILYAVWLKNVTKPTAPNAVTFTGSSQTINVKTPTGVTRGGTASATDAGTYTATYTPNSGYCWTDGTTSKVSINWTISKATPTITNPTFVSDTLTYSGSAKTMLKSVGSATLSGHGTYYVGLSTSSSSFNGTWVSSPATTSTDLMKTNAGTYYLWVKFDSSNTSNVNSVDAKYVSASKTINRAAPTYTAPTAKTNLAYCGTALDLITAGSTNHGTLSYYKNTSSSAPSATTSGWTTSVPKADEIKTYYVWYKLTGDSNHSDVGVTSLGTFTVKGKSFTITYKDGGNTTFSGSYGANNPTQHTYGTATTLVNATKTGYTFGGWYKESGCTNKVTSLGATDYTTNITLYAQWTANTYTIKFDANGGTNAPASQTKTYGVNLKLPTTTPTRTGYTFQGWGTSSTTTSVSYAVGATYTNNSATTLYAVWQANTYTISYVGLDGATCANQPTTATYNTAFMVSNPTKTGYTFAGWSITGMDSTTHTYGSATTTGTSLSGVKDTSFKNLRATSDTVKFTATWTANTYTVTLDRQSGSGGSASVTATYGSAMPTSGVTMPTRTGYTFGGYYDSTNGGGTQYYSANGTSAKTWNKTSDTTLYAKWTANEYTVTFNAGDGSFTGDAKTKNITETYDAKYVLPTTNPTRTGYTFAGWFTAANGGTQVTTDTTVKITAAQTLYAQWTANTYTVAYNANGGAGAPDNTSETYGNIVVIKAAPTRVGYTFKYWSTTADGKGTTYAVGDPVLNLTNEQGATVTLYAIWSENQTLTYDNNGHGSAPAAVTMKYNEAYTAAAAITDATGYTFNGWNTQADGKGTPYAVGDAVKAANEDPTAMTLYAQWTANQYTVTFNKNGGTTEASPTTKTVTYDSTYLVPDTNPTKTGYTFTGWFTAADGGDEVKEDTKVTITENQTLYAHWTANQYTVTFNAGDGSFTGDAKTTGIAETYDANYTLPATDPTRTGYTFAGWYTATTGGTQVTTSTTVAITAAQTLYAKWTANTYTVTLNDNGADTCEPLTSYTYGVGATLPTPTKSGYTFGGWYDNGNFTGAAVTEITTTDTGNKVFYAKWTASTCTVTFEMCYHGTAPDSSEYENVANGNKITEPDEPAATGYTFDGWYTDAGYADSARWDFSTDEVTRNTTLYAKWTANTYTVALNWGEERGMRVDVTYDETPGRVTPPTKDDYSFLGYFTEENGEGDQYYDEDGYGTRPWDIDKNDVTLYAYWKKDVEIGLGLLLDGDTGMDFTVTVNKKELEETLEESGCIKLSMGETEEEEEVSFNKAPKLSEGKYRYVFNVNALQMAEKVTIKVCIGEKEYAKATTSVEGYYNLIKDRTDYNDNAKSLAKALVNYGYYAQQAVGAKDYATSTQQGEPSTTANDLQAYKAVRTGEEKHITSFAFSLLMQNKTTLQLWFKTSDGEEPTIKVDGNIAEATKQSDKWLVTIPDIDAMHLADVHKIETDGYTYYVSALSYAAAAEVAGKYSEATAICALYDYYEAALAYSGKSGIASVTADAAGYTYNDAAITPVLTVTTTNGTALSDYKVTWDGDLTTAGEHVGIVKSNDDNVLGSQVVKIKILAAPEEPPLTTPPATDPTTPENPTNGDPEEPAEEPMPEEPAGETPEEPTNDPTGETPAEPPKEPAPEEPTNPGSEGEE